MSSQEIKDVNDRCEKLASWCRRLQRRIESLEQELELANAALTDTGQPKSKIKGKPLPIWG